MAVDDLAACDVQYHVLISIIWAGYMQCVHQCLILVFIFRRCLYQFWSGDHNHLLSKHFESLAAFHLFEKDTILGNSVTPCFSICCNTHWHDY